jgi:uncharacterized protein (DUF1330 family)
LDGRPGIGSSPGATGGADQEPGCRSDRSAHCWTAGSETDRGTCRCADQRAGGRAAGEALPKAGSHEILEGDWKPNRVVIIEFPDIASIKNWYQAPEYQPLIVLRRSAATDVMIMLDGLPCPNWSKFSADEIHAKVEAIGLERELAIRASRWVIADSARLLELTRRLVNKAGGLG